MSYRNVYGKIKCENCVSEERVHKQLFLSISKRAMNDDERRDISDLSQGEMIHSLSEADHSYCSIIGVFVFSTCTKCELMRSL